MPPVNTTVDKRFRNKRHYDLQRLMNTRALQPTERYELEELERQLQAEGPLPANQWEGNPPVNSAEAKSFIAPTNQQIAKVKEDQVNREVNDDSRKVERSAEKIEVTKVPSTPPKRQNIHSK